MIARISRVGDRATKDNRQNVAGKLKFILNTTNVSLDWDSYLTALSPKDKLHTVGAVLEPM